MKLCIYKILEYLGIFHGLAVSHLVNPRVGAKDNFKDLVEWYLDIFFNKTKDGLPLFGWFKGTLEAAKKLNKVLET
jgi:hypothetical protein